MNFAISFLARVNTHPFDMQSQTVEADGEHCDDVIINSSIDYDTCWRENMNEITRRNSKCHLITDPIKHIGNETLLESLPFCPVEKQPGYYNNARKQGKKIIGLTCIIFLMFW